jgi:hypothetical protein
MTDIERAIECFLRQVFGVTGIKKELDDCDTVLHLNSLKNLRYTGLLQDVEYLYYDLEGYQIKIKKGG